MTSKNRPGIAASKYRQVRMTFTHEMGGRASYTVYAKGLNDQWHERQVIARGSTGWEAPLRTTEDAIAAMIWVLESYMLPGID